MLEILLPILMLVGFAALAGLIFWLHRKPQAPAFDPQALLMINQRIEVLNQDLKSSLTEGVRQQQTASYQMTNTVRDVTERLVKIEETNKQILSFSGNLENLQRILSNPKQRGISKRCSKTFLPRLTFRCSTNSRMA
jgi:DNA recombination protein RmuC